MLCSQYKLVFAVARALKFDSSWALSHALLRVQTLQVNSK